MNTTNTFRSIGHTCKCAFRSVTWTRSCHVPCHVIRPEKKPQGFENYSSMGPAVPGDDRFEQQSTPNPGGCSLQRLRVPRFFRRSQPGLTRKARKTRTVGSKVRRQQLFQNSPPKKWHANWTELENPENLDHIHGGRWFRWIYRFASQESSKPPETTEPKGVETGAKTGSGRCEPRHWFLLKEM